MTLITFQDGKPLFRDGKVGTEQACCCEGAEECCGGYLNCQVSYTVTLSTGQVIEGTGYLPVLENTDVANSVGGLEFSVVGERINGICRLRIRWTTEYFCDLIDYEVVGFAAYADYALSCGSCCEQDPIQDGYAFNCNIEEIASGTSQDPPCANGIELLGDHVSSVVVNSISCDDAECNPLP